MGLDLDLVAPPPRWASSPGAPDPATQTEWKPSAALFKQWVHAVGVRYSGRYTPAGSTHRRSRASTSGRSGTSRTSASSSPREAVDRSTLEVSPRSTAPCSTRRGRRCRPPATVTTRSSSVRWRRPGIISGAGPGDFDAMPPLRYLRALYCVDAAYKPLRGQAATLRGCPPTATGSAQFAADHPGLFHAIGLRRPSLPAGAATQRSPPPTSPTSPSSPRCPSSSACSTRCSSAYGSKTTFPIWSTEFGYQTTPPDPEAGTVSPKKAGDYLNWSEYLTGATRGSSPLTSICWTDSPDAAFRHRPAVRQRDAQAQLLRVPDAALPPGVHHQDGEPAGRLGRSASCPRRRAPDAQATGRRRSSSAPAAAVRSRPSIGSRSPIATGTSRCARRFQEPDRSVWHGRRRSCPPSSAASPTPRFASLEAVARARLQTWRLVPWAAARTV